MSLAEIRDLRKSFKKGGETVTPLGGVDLDIEKGDFLSMMGPSGTGKSTLLNAVAGIDRPDSGTITIAGTEITKLSRSKLADWRAEHLGYIFQTHNLVPVLTAYENVELPTLLVPMSKAERRERVELALEAVALTDRADHYPRQLSGGREQRVGIARAIVIQPPLVLMDEPLSNLDAKLRLEMRAEIRRIHNLLGSTTIYVTHDQDEALSLADRIVVMRDGMVRQVGTPEELYARPAHADVANVEAVFLPELDDKANPLKSKGIGELGICGSGAAVANAVYNACGVRVRDYPLTLDKLILDPAFPSA